MASVCPRSLFTRKSVISSKMSENPPFQAALSGYLPDAHEEQLRSVCVASCESCQLNLLSKQMKMRQGCSWQSSGLDFAKAVGFGNQANCSRCYTLQGNVSIPKNQNLIRFVESLYYEQNMNIYEAWVPKPLMRRRFSFFVSLKLH